ncbi:MAG: shikimate kinase [Nitrososphaeria archaeon]
MRVRARVWGGIGFLNALISGYGSAMAVRLPLTVELERSKDWDCDEVAKEIIRDVGLEGRYSVKVRSEVPVGVGLKSSSAYTSAIALAALRLKGEEDPFRAVRISAKVSRALGLSYTGAYDDAYASVLGGIVLTDNSNGRLISRISAPESWKVTIGYYEGSRKRVEREKLEAFRELGLLAKSMFESGRLMLASLTNSLIVAAANGYSADPFLRFSEEGLISGISGNGPAYFVIYEDGARTFEGMKNLTTSPANQPYEVTVL